MQRDPRAWFPALILAISVVVDSLSHDVG